MFYLEDNGRRLYLCGNTHSRLSLASRPFPLVNLYAPTKSSEQCAFFDQVADILKDFNVDLDCQIIIGGAFNTHLDSNLYNLGGRIESKPLLKKIKGMMITNDFINIRRICNPDKKQFAWLLGLKEFF